MEGTIFRVSFTLFSLFAMLFISGDQDKLLPISRPKKLNPCTLSIVA